MVDAHVYEVVTESARDAGAAPQRHRVTLSPAYHRKLCGGAFTQEWVIVQAFRFLLERGSVIAAAFDLADIGERYPDFEADIAHRLGC